MSEFQSQLEKVMETHRAMPVEAQLTNAYAEAMNRVADAIHRLADAYLYVNQQEDEPSFEGQSLSDREHL